MQTQGSLLIDALFAGLTEDLPWRSFVDLLRVETQADNVFFQCHPSAKAFARGIYRLSGEVGPVADEESFFRSVWSMGPPPSQGFDDGRAYDLLAWLDMILPADAKLRRHLKRFSVSALRTVKITTSTGIEAWVYLSKMSGEFDPAVDTLLETLAPVIRGVVQVYTSSEKANYYASLGIEAARRSRIGWMTLDEQGSVIEHDVGCAELLARTTIVHIDSTGKLRIDPKTIEHEIRRRLRRIAAGESFNSPPLTLCRKPWVEITLQPARRTPISTAMPAVGLMYVHHDLGTPDRHIHLGRTLGLTPREAELALLLGQGTKISQAAADLGLTVLTVRSYLRSIYAKTGANGLPDLVRMVNRGLLASEG